MTILVELAGVSGILSVSGISRKRCKTSPSSSLRSMPPLLSGEALAFRDVFQQNQISFIENETSLPRAPLLGELAPQASERLDKGRLSSERNNAGAALYNLSVIFAHARCHCPLSALACHLPRPGESFLVGEALAFRRVFRQTQISFIENETSLPRALLPGELSSGCETERF